MSNAIKDCKNKILVKKIGNKYIICSNNIMRIHGVIVEAPKNHFLYHIAKDNKQFAISFLNMFPKDPLSILVLEGSKKINLVLFMAFIGECDLPKLVALSPSQLKFYQILGFEKESWQYLLKYDFKTFISLQDYFGVEIFKFLDPEVRMILNLAGYKVKVNIEDPEFIKIKNRLIRYESEFCVHRKINNEANEFIENYKKAIEQVKNDKIGEELFASAPFYEELDILNDFILSKDNLSFFDFDLLNKTFYTENEQLIYKFIKEKLRNMNKKAKTNDS